MKSMTLYYLPGKEYKDDPHISLALFNTTPSITLLDYNFSRIDIKDIKGFEVIILLFASLFRDILLSQGDKDGVASNDIKKETQRLQKLEMKTEERLRKEQATEIDRETGRLRKLAREEFLERKRQAEEVERETERLRREEGWYNEKPALPPRPSTSSGDKSKKSRWWRPTSYGPWSNRNGNDEDKPPKYTATSARMMGYHST
jgi:hypothetical protein